jgi:hypothetical protein
MTKTVTMRFLRETKTRRLFEEEEVPGRDGDLLGTLYVDKDQLVDAGAQGAQRLRVTIEVVA